MAQDGDTITYTYSDGSSVSEDVSSIDEMTVNYCDGTGGASKSGGRVESAVVDVSGVDTIYIWVAGDNGFTTRNGRYNGDYSGTFPAQDWGGGSTEISIENTNGSDGSDLPFLVGAGGGGGSIEGYAGERNGSANGTPPPQGGNPGEAGDGAVDDQNRGYIIDSGTSIKGGGSGADTSGEIRITYTSTGPNLGSVVQTDSSGVKQTDGSGVVQTQPWLAGKLIL